MTALVTGPGVNPLFNRKNVPLYSDLLPHDIGTGDGIPQAAANPEEIRTPALWGLRLRRPFLHDGSAATINDRRRDRSTSSRGWTGAQRRCRTP
ncbi:MAG TPA: di-heme oxidoredictase family protein [Vicinamibacterales bacterium]